MGNEFLICIDFSLEVDGSDRYTSACMDLMTLNCERRYGSCGILCVTHILFSLKYISSMVLST